MCMKIEEIKPITTEVDEYTFGQELLDIIKYTRNSECMVCTIAQGLIIYTMKYHIYMKKNKKTKMVSRFEKVKISEIYRIHRE